MTGLVNVEQHDGGVTLLRLQNPPMNALSRALLGELRDAAHALTANAEVKAVVVAGGEKAFAAGADISEFGDQDAAGAIAQSFREAFDAIAAIPRPVIAAVGGYALGGGCELALHCDMIVASENARFGQPEILLGVIPGAGGTQRLARVLGKYRTMEMVLTGVQISAQEMAAHGLVNRVVPKGEHLTEAIKLAKKVAEQAPIAIRLGKEAVNTAFETSLEEGLEVERKNFFLLFATEDMREGMQAFIEKRKADFKGR